MKKKFFALLLAFCFIIPALLSGCSFGGGNNDNGGGGDNPPVTSTPTLTIETDDQLKFSEENNRYEITLYAGATYTLVASMGDYPGSDYSIVYSWNSSGAEYANIDNNVITIKDNAPTYVNPMLTLKLQKNGSTKALDTKKIYITITERIQVTMVANSTDVELKKSNKYGVDYELSVPLAFKFYPMPAIIVDGYDDYEVDFQNSDGEYTKDKIEFILDSNMTYFRILDQFNFLSSIDFYILIKDKDGNLLKKLTCYAVETLDSDEVIEVYYGNESTQINNNETIYIEKTDKNVVPFLIYFNGTEVNPMQTYYTVENSNDDIKVEKGSTVFGWKWRISSQEIVANSIITITYNRSSDKSYEFKFNVSVCDEKELVSLVVPMGADAFKIVDNNVFVNGKIYAVYSVGNPEAINGSDNLSVQVSETANENIKRVTLSYKYRGKTEQAQFDVDVLKTTEFSKTELSQNYQKYWQNNGYATTPFEGEAKVLAIPVWFTDSNEFISIDDSVKDNDNKTQKEQIREDLNTALFGSNEDLSFRSLRTYYLEESFGKLKISGNVTDWFEISKKSTDYGDKDNAITTLMETAVDWYFDESGTSETRADYDANNDGVIDHIMIFYGANYHSFRNGKSVSAAWCRKVKNSADSYLTGSSFSWISAMNIYGLSGLSVNVYKQLERNDLSTIHGIKSKTIIHEFAHAIGIADMYDTAMKSEPTGGFNMQSGDIGAHDPYNVMAMGWANPYVFDSSNTLLNNEIEITINDFQSSGDVILLTPHWDNEKQIFDEYILLELFTATGLNQYDANASKIPNLVGIRLWHINATVDSSTNRHYNTNNSLEGNYDLVHFIRNDEECEYRTLTALSEQYLFAEGDTFDMNTFKSQFYNADGKLDNGASLGWSFEVVNITTDAYGNSTATIKLVKE